MAKSNKTRKILALSAGAAVGLSATIVLLHDSSTSSQGLKSIQAALRDGVTNSRAKADKSTWIQLACRTGKKCND